jgi:hypothetical protein
MSMPITETVLDYHPGKLQEDILASETRSISSQLAVPPYSQSETIG